MSSQLIQSNAYYYVSSDLYGSSVVLGDGLGADSPSTLFLRSGIGIFSSDNWQIFYQDPIFLIRNYDYGAGYQLGIAEDSPTLPALLPTSGELTQQWSMTLWDDGTYRLANMWLGSVQMLGVSAEDNETIPVMNAAQNGSHWSFAINAGVATNVMDDMLSLCRCRRSVEIMISCVGCCWTLTKSHRPLRQPRLRVRFRLQQAQ